MQRKPILIMAGGTGGHVYPALAIADYLHQQGVPLYWLGTKRGLEYRVVPEHRYKLLLIDVSGLRGKGLVKWCLAPFTLIQAVIQSIRILIRIKPAGVLGMGGFVSGPCGLAAWCLRIPLCIHEQNAVAGLTNRMLSYLARRVMQAFPGTFPDHIHATLTGNPVREAIQAISLPENRMETGSNTPLRILVLGGSQGARALNETVPETLEKMPEEFRFEVKHQTGEKLYSETLRRYEHIPARVELYAFIENMADAYSWADLVICRSGALTIAEIAAAGVASVLVPYPYAVDDHQTRNAGYLVSAEAAICIQEKEFNKNSLAELLGLFYNSRNLLLKMANAARSLAMPDATRAVADLCMETAYGR